jgi:hypothetical protein
MYVNGCSGPIARANSAVLTTLAVVACTSGGSGSEGGGCNGGGDLVFAEENLYSFSAGFETEQILEIEAQQEVTVDWSAMTTDLRGRPLDPSTVEQVALLNVKAPPEEVFRMIAENDIGSDDLQDQTLFVNDGLTSANLSEFEITDLRFDLALLEERADRTWLVSLMNVSDGRNDILGTAVFQPKAEVDGHEVVFFDGISRLTDVQVDIATKAPLTTKEGLGSYSLDWSGLAVDTFGHAIVAEQADELFIGHYSGDVASVEADFLQIDTIADELYRLDVYGTTGALLGEAVDARGGSFGGFTRDGTWLVGIVCTGCATPAPLILGHVQVE